MVEELTAGLGVVVLINLWGLLGIMDGWLGPLYGAVSGNWALVGLALGVVGIVLAENGLKHRCCVDTNVFKEVAQRMFGEARGSEFLLLVIKLVSAIGASVCVGIMVRACP